MNELSFFIRQKMFLIHHFIIFFGVLKLFFIQYCQFKIHFTGTVLLGDICNSLLQPSRDVENLATRGPISIKTSVEEQNKYSNPFRIFLDYLVIVEVKFILKTTGITLCGNNLSPIL